MRTYDEPSPWDTDPESTEASSLHSVFGRVAAVPDINPGTVDQLDLTGGAIAGFNAAVSHIMEPRIYAKFLEDHHDLEILMKVARKFLEDMGELYWKAYWRG